MVGSEQLAGDHWCPRREWLSRSACDRDARQQESGSMNPDGRQQISQLHHAAYVTSTIAPPLSLLAMKPHGASWTLGYPRIDGASPRGTECRSPAPRSRRKSAPKVRARPDGGARPRRHRPRQSAGETPRTPEKDACAGSPERPHRPRDCRALGIKWLLSVQPPCLPSSRSDDASLETIRQPPADPRSKAISNSGQ